jgi:hypothetical protein
MQVFNSLTLMYQSFPGTKFWISCVDTLFEQDTVTNRRVSIKKANREAPRSRPVIWGFVHLKTSLDHFIFFVASRAPPTTNPLGGSLP